MKTLSHILFIFLIIGCKAKSTNVITEQQEFKAMSNCPNDGVCTVELIPNSSLILKEDTIGSIYTNIVEGEKTIFKFSFKRNEDKMNVDGHYFEEVYAEFDSNLNDLDIENEQLKDVKLLFNRVCYCKGSAGFYPIKNGKLTLKKIDDKTINILLDFKVDEVPQVITSLNETLILE
ncbi:hypothetical protein [Urechidicola croceus]|uniref:Lipoprotein n=1 Tax=Urechidicola croceus TaxID=1850246 RepID=A0A1D8P8P7_9FLAO|nr:hypothetical protein [Urechidicola croceus]AOW20939.1 hypothetical protein LPB138_09755 [Urechidicola croceus]